MEREKVPLYIVKKPGKHYINQVMKVNIISDVTMTACLKMM